MYIPFKRYKISVNLHIFSSNDNNYELRGAKKTAEKSERNS